ncbi:MAG: helix-turn-helix domain-containing protein [Deltaproteobacteria bacterium]|nr:helix-turn-helix domain-containing protein [Deltaproteobacteria bacterium]
MDEYLTVDELCRRIKFAKQTIYNLIHRKSFIAGKHYIKPSPKKILFKWSEIQAWLGESPSSVRVEPSASLQEEPALPLPKSLIKI